MKIKTITCHDVYNHGASLQAFALQYYLESCGHDVEIIDYKPPYLSGHYKLSAVCNPIYDKPIIKQAYLLAKLPGRIRSLKRKKAFDRFTHKYLKLTCRYNCYQELVTCPPESDVYIAGSDQIWNTQFQNGRDPAFYLAFAPKDKLRLSYAASFSTTDIHPDYRSFVVEMLGNINRISIRERTALPLLASLGRPDGVAVCDPVFLLSRKQWNLLSSNVEKNVSPYLLIYDTEGSAKLKSIAVKIANILHLPIYNIGISSGTSAKMKLFPFAGPLEFLQLIQGASYVVSNSFHATAFSLIFEKDFCVVERSESINERMYSLLNYCGLSNRIADGFNQLLVESVNYDEIRTRVREMVESGISFLKHSGL